jgi:hypothetical protein
MPEVTPMTTFSAKKPLSITAVLVVIGVVALERFVLKGDEVFRGSAYAGDSNNTLVIPVSKTGVSYTLQVYPRSSSRNRKPALKVKLESPGGVVILDRTEIANRKGSRLYNFKPSKPGDYKLTLGMRMLSGRRVRCSVKLLVNDRRVFNQLTSRFLVF